METNIDVASPSATVDGKTISQWTQDWLKWVMHAPAADPVGDPFSVTTVEPPGNANFNNDGSVFFLYGGDWGTDPATLPSINVPAGKNVLVPMINAFDIESGHSKISTIPDWTKITHLPYAAESEFITLAANQSIYDAYLTLTKVGQTQPVIDLKWPQTQAYNEDTGQFALGNPQASDYLGSILTSSHISLNQHDLPFTEEVGRWAMLTGLDKGDYVINFGGAGHPVYNPFDHSQQILGLDGKDWVHNTTEILHVG